MEDGHGRCAALEATAGPAPPGTRRYATPTGQPCPRTVHVDGTIEGSGECLWCGFCLLIAEAGWRTTAGSSG